ncbi:MAG: protein disulfide oxidoreductase [Candidatus Thorarchaeota archaeon]|jgi:glutaredoxin-like protein
MVVEIDEDTQAQVKELFEPMVNDVTMHVFIDGEKCLYCNDVRSMAEQISALSDKINLEIHEGEPQTGKAAEFGVKYVPATVLHGEAPYKIKFYGIAAGHEFGALIGSIVDVSNGGAQLPPDIVEDIQAIDKPIHIQVFTTPQCPYCPAMVRLSNQAAILNPLIESDMIESLEFQELATKYEVYGVPKTIFNETVSIEGLTPPAMFIEKLFEAIGE